jgi:hypothetical protein
MGREFLSFCGIFCIGFGYPFGICRFIKDNRNLLFFTGILGPSASPEPNTAINSFDLN